jgi:3-phenylpropionate/trans-cinnamate dioxygenase ferredoxin subunit
MAENFTAVGKADEVPEGDMRSYEVGGQDVAVARIDGKLYSFGNICTHQQCQLSDGDLDGTRVTCPCHGSQFDVATGDVLNGPATLPVDSYAVSEEGGELRIGI